MASKDESPHAGAILVVDYDGQLPGSIRSVYVYMGLLSLFHPGA